MTPIMWLNLVLGLIILAIALNWAYFQIMGRRSATIISEDEFKAGMKKANVYILKEGYEGWSGKTKKKNSL